MRAGLIVTQAGAIILEIRATDLGFLSARGARIEHVLRGAADPGGSGVGFQKLELGPPGSGLRLTQVLGD